MRILQLLERVNEWAGKIVAPLMVAFVVVLIWEVIARYVFRSPTKWAHETTTMIFGVYFILAGGYALRHRVHVNMDLVYSRLSTRGKAILDLITSPLFFLFCLLIVWKGSEMALRSLINLETSNSNWGPPLYPIKIAIPLGGFLILLEGFTKLVRDILNVKRGT